MSSTSSSRHSDLRRYQLPHDPDSYHQLHWQPGQTGKGLLLPNGQLHTWEVGFVDGDPVHGRYIREKNLDAGPGTGHFWIDTDGAIDGLLTQAQRKSIQAIEPRLDATAGYEGIWHFGGTAEEDTDKIMELLFGPGKRPMMPAPMKPDPELDRIRKEKAEDPIGYERRNDWDVPGDVQHGHSSIEWVPTHELAKFMEYDRRPGGKDSWENVERWNALGEHIKQHGFKEPVVLYYDPTAETAHMAEGNHRTQIALDHGIPSMPVRVWRDSYRYPRRSETAIPVKLKPEETWRDFQGELQIPDSLKPSHIGLTTVPAPNQPKLAHVSELYHVAPRDRRESIQRHGLTGHLGYEGETASPWQQNFGQPPGNYLYPSLEAARVYVSTLAQKQHGGRYPGDLPQGTQHPGYDIWHVNPQGLEITPDPEPYLVEKKELGENPPTLHPDEIQQDDKITEDRWMTHKHVEPNRLTLHHHVPAQEINDLWADEAHRAAEDHLVDPEWNFIHPRHIHPKPLPPEVRKVWGGWDFSTFNSDE